MDSKTKKAAIRLLVKFGIIAAAIWITFSLLITLRIVHDNTNFPTIRDGDLVIFRRFGENYADDLVIYRAEDGQERIGRVIAIAGDAVKIDEGGVLVNGSYRLDDNPYKTAFENEEEVLVGDDELFILAEYREETDDSRSFGPVKTDAVIGKAFFSMRHRGL